MNWVRENQFLTGIIVVAILVAGGLGYLLSQKMSEFEMVNAEYENQVRQLHTLQNRTPFPSQENLTRTREMVEQYREALAEFAGELKSLQLEPDTGITPQAFQDRLRAQVSEFDGKAREAGVELPENFYFGFDEYRATPPSSDAAPALARQLEAIRLVVAKLIDARVQRIDTLMRARLPQETGGAARDGQLLSKYSLDIGFTSEQSRARLALNSLLGLPEFAIVRAVRVRNSQLEGPLRDGTPATQAEDPLAAFGTEIQPATLTTGGGELQVILGRESLSVQVRIDLVDFAEINLTE